MTKEVTVTIDGLQLGDEEGAVSITAPGIYHFRNGKHFIHYDESIEGGEGVTNNVIKITSNKIEIIKKGIYTTEMVFDIKESTESSYHTPYGRLLLQIHTVKLQVEESRNEILVKLQYKLSANDGPLSENQILISVCSIG